MPNLSLSRIFGVLAAIAAFGLAPQPAAAQEIKIGFSMAMTGGLGPNGKSALLAQKIWEEDVNKKGGLLGRPVKLIYYDDQTNPSTVPGIYAKLLDVDKVDLIVGGYGTNMLAPAMPLVMQRKKMFIGLLGLGVNSEFNYPNYFVMIPSGPIRSPRSPRASSTSPWRRTRSRRRSRSSPPTPSSRATPPTAPARTPSKAASRSSTTRPIRRRPPTSRRSCAPSQATNPDVVVICSYPPDSVGMVRAVNEIGFKPKLIGGAMVGPQNTSIKAQLGPLLNGFDQLRLLAAGAEDGVPRRGRPDEEVPGQGGGAKASIRSATTWRR